MTIENRKVHQEALLDTSFTISESKSDKDGTQSVFTIQEAEDDNNDDTLEMEINKNPTTPIMQQSTQQQQETNKELDQLKRQLNKNSDTESATVSIVEFLLGSI